VEILVQEGVERVLDLIRAGARFDEEGGRLRLHREAAHSRRRVLHAHGDATGREIQRVLTQMLLDAERIQVFENTPAAALLLSQGRCCGVAAVNENQRRTLIFSAKAVILATGGAGQLYKRTTNPAVATGDGLALALAAGAELEDMEMVQFHPTVLCAEGAPAFLITEAVRGEGAVLLNREGEAFMARYHPQAELAPRDVVSRAILQEMERTGASHVLLDLRPLGAKLESRFPTVTHTLRAYGLDPTREPVPVTPAAHYMMGGIRTDLTGQSSLEGLFAAGECACTGAHGANRLASNSILEGLVYGHRSGVSAAQWLEDKSVLSVGEAEARPLLLSPTIVPAIREEMWEHAGVARSAASLEKALQVLRSLRAGAAANDSVRAALEAAHLRLVGLAVCASALAREESRGAHYRTDFPLTDDARFRRHSLARLGAGGEIEVSFTTPLAAARLDERTASVVTGA